MTSDASNLDQDAKISSDAVSVPSTNVSVYEALYRRRMSWQLSSAPVSRETIDRMLAAAVWAPNHRLTEPWRFFVVDKDSPVRQKVAGLAYEFSMQRNNNPERAAAVRSSVADPPILIYVYCVPGPNEDTTQENYAAVCCAAQNISLAGVAEGLAVTWETGGATRHPQLKATLGAEEDWTLAAMLSVGVPEDNPQASRTPVTAFARWVT
ncbi:MAG: nitroreductase [Chloroflexi bacterium]|nr:nitroreductase [Chloroflexota bacterium]MCH8348746.1 nitroreductase [Chloroflexota bacterium]MCI0779921.1 nitroreductase [Chloroflexota bacterium]MCI0797149.1 nitroreductase [Chloroflexota bacterium]MCI0826022.1 nitroreductase [Chloroflexota bacterium]